MKSFFAIIRLSIIGMLILFFSCKKERSCQTCGVNPPPPQGGINKPPVANAGPDQTITLPIDSASLNGTASHDPDGTISSFQWTKISGPASFNFINSSSSITTVKNLLAGVYKFELNVTDDKGLSAKDTMQVIVNDPTQPNRPPVANAGPDQIITLPVGAVSLDGSASSDPDNNITNYLWAKISGPVSFSIVNPTAVQTQVVNMTAGVYQFELKITDAGGLFSKDTVQVTINAATIGTCGTRPVINATLVPIGTLSSARLNLMGGTAGSKILFAGGNHSTRVDIYDTITNSWSTAELTEARRDGMAVASVGSKIFFVGGGDNDWTDIVSRVDIYDASTNTWSTAELSEPRKYLSAVTLGNKIFFAGGGKWGPLFCGQPPAGWPPNADYYIGSRVVDIYDNTTNTWTTATLSEGRFELSATVVGNKIYFAGGLQSIFCGSKTIDIYDAVTNSWTTDQLSDVKASHAGIAVGNKIFWAAGAYTSYWYGYKVSDKVEIRDVITGVSVFDCITSKAQFATVRKNDNIIFFTATNAGDKFDIYNTTTNTWSIAILPVSITNAAIISVNNEVYVAGGMVNGGYSDQVWKLEF